MKSLMGLKMKRALSARSKIGTVCAAAFLLFGCALEPGDAADDYSQVTQEVNPPVQVTTLAQLRGMGGSNSYVLMNNINASSTSTTPFVPIGTSAAKFTGSFDGNGYTISNLKIAGNRQFAGMFGYASGANISNVKLTNAQLTNNAMYSGAIVGYLHNSNLSDCEASGTISGAHSTGGLIGTAHSSYVVGAKASGMSVSGANAVGNVVGMIQSGTYVINSSATGGSVVGVNATGGLVGWAQQSNISYSTATTVNVQGTSDFTGGMVGWIVEGSLNYDSASGTIQGVNMTGGLVGYNSGTNIASSSAMVTVTGAESTGGLVGRAISSSIANSNVSGAVTGSTNTGGLVGRMYGTNTRRAVLEDSYIDNTPSSAESVVTGGTPVGMAIGLAESYLDLNRNYAIGRVTGSSKRIGGFVGEIKAPWPSSAPSSTRVIARELFTNVQVDPVFDGGSDPVYAGGLVGYMLGADIENINVTGSVIGRGYVGGALGYVKNSGTDVVASVVQSVLTRGIVTNVATPNRSGVIGGTDADFVRCSINYWDTTTDGGSAPPLTGVTDSLCQAGRTSTQLKSPNGAYISSMLPHGDYRIFTYGLYIDAAYEAEFGVQPSCRRGSGSDGDFGFGFCHGILPGSDPVVWQLNANSEYNTLVNIPNPSRQPKN